VSFDLVVRGAQLRRQRGLVDIGVHDARIVEIAPQLRGPGLIEIDAGGRLATEPFVDCHLHIDKSFTASASGRFTYPLADGPRRTPLEEYKLLKPEYTVDEVFARVCRALDLSLAHGTLAMRMFVDVDAVQGLTALHAAVRARERYAGRMALQICVFPQDGNLAPATVGLMEQAMGQGADVVGAIPGAEPDEASARAHVHQAFVLAEHFGCDLHLSCDDTRDPSSRTLEMVAAAALRSPRRGRVAASHNGALRFYPDDYAAGVVDLVKRAGIDMVVLPALDLLGAVTRVEELLAAGVNVCAGQDDVDNFFYPLGRANMLDAVFLIAHIARLVTPQGLETAFDVAAGNGTRALGLAPSRVEAGATADIVVHEGRSLQDVLRTQAPPVHVISRGRAIAASGRVLAAGTRP
jgi:cytosine deaminase